jgi:hypothetical protein
MISSRKQESQMKHIATMALMLNLAIASVYAQHPVKMMFSGTGGAGLIDLKQPGTANVEEIETGNGTLGPFTIRIISAETAPLQEQPSTCSGPTHLYSERVAGGGVLRFRDGSLLMVSLTQGTDCIDLAAQQALCTITFQVIGGTGRFKNASGMLTYTETVQPVLADASSNPVFFADSGEFTGTISGVGMEEFQDVRQ